MAEEAKTKGRSTFKGHPIIWLNEQWVYEDTKEPIPGWGGKLRPCLKCGSSKWSGDGDVDECLGVLPGVDNACCGHGDPETSYIHFTNGVMIRGFTLIDDSA